MLTHQATTQSPQHTNSCCPTQNTQCLQSSTEAAAAKWSRRELSLSFFFPNKCRAVPACLSAEAAASLNSCQCCVSQLLQASSRPQASTLMGCDTHAAFSAGSCIRQRATCCCCCACPAEQRMVMCVEAGWRRVGLRSCSTGLAATRSTVD